MRRYAALIVLSIAAALVGLICLLPRVAMPKQPAPVMFCEMTDGSFAPCALYVGIERT